MTDEERIRMLGVRDGLHNAIITVGKLRGAITGPANAYLPPRHHTRKRAAVERRIAELDQVTDALQRNLEAVRTALSN